VRARARLFRGRDGQLLSTTSVLLPATRKVSWLLGIPPERPSTATRIAEHFKKHWYIWLIAGAVATAFIVTELGSDDRVARGVHGRYTPDNFATGSGTD